MNVVCRITHVLCISSQGNVCVCIKIWSFTLTVIEVTSYNTSTNQRALNNRYYHRSGRSVVRLIECIRFEIYDLFCGFHSAWPFHDGMTCPCCCYRLLSFGGVIVIYFDRQHFRSQRILQHNINRNAQHVHEMWLKEMYEVPNQVVVEFQFGNNVEMDTQIQPRTPAR